MLAQKILTIWRTKSESLKTKFRSRNLTLYAQQYGLNAKKPFRAMYIELNPFVVRALEEAKTCKNPKTLTKISQLLTAISNEKFQISCLILRSVHSVILPLNRQLQ